LSYSPTLDPFGSESRLDSRVFRRCAQQFRAVGFPEELTLMSGDHFVEASPGSLTRQRLTLDGFDALARRQKLLDRLSPENIKTDQLIETLLDLLIRQLRLVRSHLVAPLL
jgi:hypothetical protein